jgi:hypothetical protein
VLIAPGYFTSPIQELRPVLQYEPITAASHPETVSAITAGKPPRVTDVWGLATLFTFFG